MSIKSLKLLKEVVVFFLILSSLVAFVDSDSFASRKIEEVNYYASLRSNEANVRAGPGQQYPIKFTFKLRGIPVKVISEYDNWNEIQDYEGQSGWVTQSLVTKRRTLMIRTTKSFVDMHSKNKESSKVLLRLENNVIGDYLKCLEDWCAMKVNNKKGWVRKEYIFGGD